MKLWKQKGKKIGIIGLGLTGLSLYRALNKVACEIICYDDSIKNQKSFLRKFSTPNLIPLSNNKWKLLDLIIISPGIVYTHPIYNLASKYNITISSDIELFIEENSSSQFIVVTGSNGKSTTVSMISRILKKNNFNYYTGGNIGIPVLSLPFHAEGYIIELSSFQLNLLKRQNIFPKKTISVLLNIASDHLDRHKNIYEYIRIKKRILNNNGINVIAIDNQITANIYQQQLKITKRNCIAVSGLQLLSNGVSCNKTNIIDNYFDKKSYPLPIMNNFLGQHNLPNIAASITVCRALGINIKNILTSLKGYKNLKHRMQYIKSNNDIHFYNDSKATNTHSTAAAISNLHNIYWLAGGIFKESNFWLLDNYIHKIKKAYLFGRDKIIIANYLNYKVDYEIFDSISESFYAAVSDAKKNNNAVSPANILLSPACASYDQFKSFIQRGNKFISLILKFNNTYNKNDFFGINLNKGDHS